MAGPQPATFEEELLSALEAVHRFALSLARDRARAEDLVQDTYLRALAHREQFAPGTNCRAWLFTICRNAFLKGETRQARETPVEDAELEALGAAAVHASVAEGKVQECIGCYQVKADNDYIYTGVVP